MKNASKANNSVDYQKCRNRMKRSPIIQKASQDEHQNQTTTTNINYIQNLFT